MKKLILSIIILLFAVGQGWGADTTLATCQGSNEICYCDDSEDSGCSEAGEFWTGYATFTALVATETLDDETLQLQYAEETGKNAIWRGKKTKGYEDWKKEKLS